MCRETEPLLFVIEQSLCVGKINETFRKLSSIYLPWSWTRFSRAEQRLAT